MLQSPPQSLGDKYSPKEPSYQFRTAESFLNSLNKTKTEGVDLSKFRAGVTVYHKKFGEGTIITAMKVGADYKITIAFDNQGIKNLMLSFAHLELL